MRRPVDEAGVPRSAEPRRFKRPESVLVVVHTRALECLVLRRLTPPDFWQSVTGALGWDETPREAAARELGEETGLDAAGLVDAETAVSFPILPEWRDRYAPGTASNLERWFYLELPAVRSVRLNAAEHVEHAWLELEAAIARVASGTNRAALERLRAPGPPEGGAGKRGQTPFPPGHGV